MQWQGSNTERLTRILARRAGIAVVGALLLGAGCSRDGARAVARGQFRGVTLPQSIEKPSFVLTDMNGRSYDFRAETDGDIALLFFGYTNCPDICPVHLANLAAVLAKMPESEARRVHLVFITTDPVRDTDERLRQWLANFNPRFVGIRAPEPELLRLQMESMMQPAMVMSPKPAADSMHYDVNHGAQIVAFTPDNKAHLVYPGGVRQTDWAHDLPLLLSASWGEHQ